jgi:predicted RNase H-like HicB family nuclease
MNLTIEVEREDDGRWIAEVPDLPGVLVYGVSRAEAIARVQALALRVLADRLGHGEDVPALDGVFSVPTRASGVRPRPNGSSQPSCESGGS